MRFTVRWLGVCVCVMCVWALKDHRKQIVWARNLGQGHAVPSLWWFLLIWRFFTLSWLVLLTADRSLLLCFHSGGEMHLDFSVRRWCSVRIPRLFRLACRASVKVAHSVSLQQVSCAVTVEQVDLNKWVLLKIEDREQGERGSDRGGGGGGAGWGEGRWAKRTGRE